MPVTTSRNRLRRLGHLGAVLAAVLLAASPASATNQIRVSQSPERALGSTLLDGAVIFGEVFIFFDNSTPESEIDSVAFFIDGKLGPTYTMAPYDLVDGGEPFDTSKLNALKDPAEPHRIEVRMSSLIPGTPVLSFVAAFTVDNNLAPLESGTSLRIVTATADVAAGRLTLEGFNLARNLDKEVPPEVALDLTPLDIEFFDDSTLEATLPPEFSVGDHLLNVSTDGKLAPGLHDSDHAELLVTIGATNLSCVGCVSAPEVSFSYAGSASAGGKAFEASLADLATNSDFAANADLLDGFDSTAFANLGHIHPSSWQNSGNNVFYNGGNVGIGTTAPTSKLFVNSAVNSRALTLFK